MIPKKALIELHYLPGIKYFQLLRSFDHVILESFENFQKQTFRNRCQILSAQGKLDLSIPLKKGNSKVPIRLINMDHSQKWAKEHWRAIQSAYGKAPFWEFYQQYFQDYFSSEESGLFNFNMSLLTLCLKLLRLEVSFSQSETYQPEPEGDTIDLRESIHPKRSSVLTDNMEVCKYQQVFGSDFVENLSIIDLIFNQGPQSLEFIEPLSVEKINFET